LNDLSSTEAAGAVTAIPAEIKTEEDSDRSEGTATITVAVAPYLKVLPASAIQLGSQDGTLQGIQTLTMTNAGGGTTGAIVQYATQGQDGQFYVPGIYHFLTFIYSSITPSLILLFYQSPYQLLIFRLIKSELPHKQVSHRELS